MKILESIRMADKNKIKLEQSQKLVDQLMARLKRTALNMTTYWLKVKTMTQTTNFQNYEA